MGPLVGVLGPVPAGDKGVPPIDRLALGEFCAASTACNAAAIAAGVFALISCGSCECAIDGDAWPVPLPALPLPVWDLPAPDPDAFGAVRRDNSCGARRAALPPPPAPEEVGVRLSGQGMPSSDVPEVDGPRGICRLGMLLSMPARMVGSLRAPVPPALPGVGDGVDAGALAAVAIRAEEDAERPDSKGGLPTGLLVPWVKAECGVSRVEIGGKPLDVGEEGLVVASSSSSAGAEALSSTGCTCGLGGARLSVVSACPVGTEFTVGCTVGAASPAALGSS